MTNAVFKELIHMGMGEEAALELASLTDTSHLATKEDMLVLQESILQVKLDTQLGIEKHRQETSKQLSGMREQMAEFKHSVDTRLNSFQHAMGEQRQELLAEIKDVRGEIKDVRGEIQDIGGEIQDIRGEIQDIRDEIKDIRGEIKDVRGEIKDVRGEIQDIRGEMREQFAQLHTDLKTGIQSSNRQYVLTFGGLLVTIAVVLAVNVYFR